MKSTDGLPSASIKNEIEEKYEDVLRIERFSVIVDLCHGFVSILHLLHIFKYINKQTGCLDWVTRSDVFLTLGPSMKGKQVDSLWDCSYLNPRLQV